MSLSNSEILLVPLKIWLIFDSVGHLERTQPLPLLVPATVLKPQGLWEMRGQWTMVKALFWTEPGWPWLITLWGRCRRGFFPHTAGLLWWADQSPDTRACLGSSIKIVTKEDVAWEFAIVEMETFKFCIIIIFLSILQRLAVISEKAVEMITLHLHDTTICTALGWFINCALQLKIFICFFPVRFCLFEMSAQLSFTKMFNLLSAAPWQSSCSLPMYHGTALPQTPPRGTLVSEWRPGRAGWSWALWSHSPWGTAAPPPSCSPSEL